MWWSASSAIRCRCTGKSQMLARQGITLDRSTLSNWVGRACWWLTPLYELVLGTVLSSTKVFADDTTLPVLDPGRGRTKTGRLWCYAVDDRPGAARRTLLPPTSTPRTAKACIRPSTWRDLRACCRSTAMRASSGWPGTAPTSRCGWRSAGRTCGASFSEFHASTQSPLAAEVLARVAALYAIEAEIRGPSGRPSKTGAPAAKSPDRRRPA